MIDPLDRRRNAVRDDLADIRLQGKVEAPAFATGTEGWLVTAPSVPCWQRPAHEGPVDTTLLHGERLTVLETSGDWCWIQSKVDRYVGYVPRYAIGPSGAAKAQSHRVTAPLALVFGKPSIKVLPATAFPMGAMVAAQETVAAGDERFHRIAADRYILAQHLGPIDAVKADWVQLAALFVGAPYMWGGKSWDGIDCSGLVQLALQVADIPAPRDSDMQAEELGTALSANAPLTRGDLVFWRGHVGIMVDEERLLHASGHHMMTVVEPLAEAVERIGAKGLPVTVRRRIDPR